MSDQIVGERPRARPATSDPDLDLGESDVLQIAARNSLDFLEAAFECYRAGRVFSIARGDTSLEGRVGSVETRALQEPPRLGWMRPEHAPSMSDDPAQIVFTSGTEGPPKAIVLSHRNLADVVERLNDVMGLTEEVREYLGVPVTYSFGLGRARAVASAGGELFLPERFDPAEIRRMLDAGEINAISAVPSLWRLVLSNPDIIGAAGQHVRWIEIGSQFMAESDKAAMRDLFPEARIVQHYGLTEASRTTFLDITAAPEAVLGSVGQATGSVETRITGEGAIAIRGDHVALGRLEEGGRIAPLTDAGGWLVTRDRGEMQGEHLWYRGRLDDQINVGGLKIGAEALEAAIAELVPAAAGRIAATAIPDAARGEAVLLAHERDLGDSAALVETAARVALARRGIEAPGALHILAVDALPRTGTDKIQRSALREMWSEPEETSPAEPATGDLSEIETKLADDWRRVVGPAALSAQSSFYDAGGDSLSSVQIGLVMEGAGWPGAAIRATFEGRPLSEVARLARGDAATPDTAPAETLPDRTIRSWSVSLARGFMALTVLLSHFGPGFFGRLGLERQAETWLSIFYRAGTPGFATVFGIGIGFFMLPDFAGNRASVLRRLGLSFRLVLLGIVLLGCMEMLKHALDDGGLGGLQVANGLYNVLGYYAVMLGTARLWLPALARGPDPAVVLVAAVPVLWLAWQAAVALIPAAQQDDLLEWPRLMIAAGGYNVFKMTMTAAAGTALGLWVSRQRDTAAMADRLILLGGAAAALCLFAMSEAGGVAPLGDRSNPVFTSVPGLMFYVALAALLMGLGVRITSAWQHMGRLARLPVKALIVIGGLALPIYVFHGLVLPAREVLRLSGLPPEAALLLPLGLFTGGMLYAGRRVWRMYFG